MTTNSVVAYEKRVVVFGDILGWAAATKDPTKNFDRQKNVINGIEHHASNFSSKTKEALRRAPEASSQAIAEHAAIEFSFFSDSFAISVLLDHAKLAFKILAWASDALLQEGFLARGGITVGDLFHRGGKIFGPALVEAVQMEKDAAYPRFLCSKVLLAHLDAIKLKNKPVLMDSCGDWVANIACGSSHALERHLKVIRKQHHESKRIARKWQYMEKMLPIMYEKH